MDIAQILLREVSVMALMIIIGVFTKKKGFFTVETAKQLSGLLLCIVMPVMLINIFQRERQPDMMPRFWASMILAIALFTITPLIATLIFRKKGNQPNYLSNRIAAVQPNCGYMGIPLLLATTGEDSLLYSAVIIGIFQIVVWVWSIPLMERSKLSVKKIIINPGTIAFAVGMVLFLSGLRLPAVLYSLSSQLMTINTPLSMLMIGILLADIDPKAIFSSKSLYAAVFFRNIAFPMLTLFVIYVCGLTQMFGKVFSLAIIITFSCPAAANTMLVPLKAGRDSTYASCLIAVSTLLSIITIPLIAYIAQTIL